MKKYLGTTAIITLVASSAIASDITTKIGGNVDFEFGKVIQKEEYRENLSPNQKSFKMRNRAHIFVSAEGSAENGTTYGAIAKIKGTTEQKTGISNGKVDKTYIWIEGQSGRVELGSNFEVSKLMSVGADSIASATGGASDGNWMDYASTINMPNLINSDTFISNYRNKAESDRKISWISPRYSNFQFGVSYSPDINNNVYQNLNDPKVKNALSLAVNYTGIYNDYNIAASLAHDMGKTTIKNTKNIASTKAGVAIGKNGFTLATSYGNDGKSYMKKDEQGYTSKFYTAGIAYEDGPMTTSLTLLNRNTNNSSSKAKLTSYALGLDYKLAAGLKTFAEVTAFKVKDKEKSGFVKNKGTVVIIGSKVSF